MPTTLADAPENVIFDVLWGEHRLKRQRIGDRVYCPAGTPCPGCPPTEYVIIPISGGTASDASTQVGGDHYKDQGMDVIAFCRANSTPFSEGNAIKYIVRHRDKGGSEDIKKALSYLARILKDDYGLIATVEYRDNLNED